MHPVLAAIAEDAIAANSVPEMAHGNFPALQEVQAGTTDHDLCLSCIYSVLSPSLLLSKSRAS